MNKINIVNTLILFLIILSSCSEESNINTEIEQVYVSLINENSSVIIEGEPTKLKYTIVLSKSFKKDVTLNLNYENSDKFPNLLKFPEKITIKKNQTKGSFFVNGVEKKDDDNILTEDIQFKIIFDKQSQEKNKLVFDNEYKITVKKEKILEFLTEKQRELVKIYKSKGMDLTKLLGKIPVEVKVTTGGNSTYAFMEESTTKSYTGTTYITLSEHATAEKPLLKMTENAFGLNEHFQWVFRGHTIENNSFWYTDDPTTPNYDYFPPGPKKVIKAIGEERFNKWKNKEYSFNVVVDDILVNPDKTFTYVYEDGAYGTYTAFPITCKKDEERITAINYQFEFPLWDELMVIAKDDKELIDYIIQGGTVHPNDYINHSRIDINDWAEDGGSKWVPPTSCYCGNEIKFNFTTDYDQSGDYDVFEVTFKLK